MDETQAARDKVVSHLAERPNATEHQLAVEGLRYLEASKTLPKKYYAAFDVPWTNASSEAMVASMLSFRVLRFRANIE